jgi:hypothetical protein
MLSLVCAETTLSSALASNLTNHGDPNLHWTSATFTDIGIFYLANYFAHCATVKMMPGESGMFFFANAAMALFFPTYGIMRAVSAIIRHARFTKKDELWVATRSGALCMVVRSRFWTPRDSDVLRQCRTTTSQTGVSSWRYEFSSKMAMDSEMQDMSKFLDKLPDGSIPMTVWNPSWMAELLPVPGSQRIYPSRRNVYGKMIIPEGYRLVYVPSDAEVVPITKHTGSLEFASKHYGELLGISQ